MEELRRLGGGGGGVLRHYLDLHGGGGVLLVGEGLELGLGLVQTLKRLLLETLQHGRDGAPLWFELVSEQDGLVSAVRRGHGVKEGIVEQRQRGQGGRGRQGGVAVGVCRARPVAGCRAGGHRVVEDGEGGHLVHRGGQGGGQGGRQPGGGGGGGLGVEVGQGGRVPQRGQGGHLCRRHGVGV